MDDPKQPEASKRALPQWWRTLSNPSASTEAIVWAFLIFTVIAIRAYLVHLVPVAIWSDDAGSYVGSAFRWVHTGVWATDPRRGPIYSLLIAACSKLTGNIDSVMLVQHFLGGISVLLAMASLRALYDRTMLVPIALCSYAYAVYGLPIYLEQLIRNETLLFFFSSVAIASWLFAIKFEKPHLLWISGIAAGLLMSTKSVFGPFPLIVILGHLFYWRSTPGLAVKFALIFMVAFALPLAGVRVLKRLTVHNAPPQPQAGILLYARTAQFTVLEGGIEPEIKEQIHQEVEDYRKHILKIGHLDNNEIIYRTIAPHLSRILRSQGKLPADVSNLCMRLALEGINHHKAQYASQVLHDLERLHLKGGYKLDSPKPKDLSSVAAKLKDPKELKHPDPLMRIDETVAQLEAHDGANQFKTFHRLIKTSWMFLLAPVLFTTILLPLIIFLKRDRMQLFWIGAAAVWFFTMVLLSTVGRPLDRYLIPAVPVMFLTLSTGVVYAWEWLNSFLTKKFRPPLGDSAGD